MRCETQDLPSSARKVQHKQFASLGTTHIERYFLNANDPMLPQIPSPDAWLPIIGNSLSNPF